MSHLLDVKLTLQLTNPSELLLLPTDPPFHTGCDITTGLDGNQGLCPSDWSRWQYSEVSFRLVRGGQHEAVSFDWSG